MPDRYVRAGILTSERVNALSWPEEVFYRRLMSVVDDYGRYDARNAILRADLYPLKLDSVRETDIATWKRCAAEAGLVRLYLVDGKEYLEVNNFRQRTRSPSKWPEPPPLTSADKCQQVSDTRGHPPPYSVSISRSNSIAQVEGDNPPNPPAGGAGESPKRTREKSTKTDGRSVPIPESLNTPEFVAAWSEWLSERADRKQPKTDRGWAAELAEYVRYGPVVSAMAIRQSIRQGWAGTYPEKINGSGTNNAGGRAGVHQSPARIDGSATLAQMQAEINHSGDARG